MDSVGARFMISLLVTRKCIKMALVHGEPRRLLISWAEISCFSQFTMTAQVPIFASIAKWRVVYCEYKLYSQLGNPILYYKAGHYRKCKIMCYFAYLII
jgi:hypothetical protein